MQSSEPTVARISASGNVSWRNSIGRLWRARGQYVSTYDWFLSFYHRLLLYLPWLPLFGRQATRQVWLRGMPEPLQVRLGTTDWYVLEEVFLDATYQPLIQHHLSDVRFILDLGANVGFTVRLWQTLYPAARIVAVEPDAANLEMCNHNALKNSATRPGLIQACAAGTARAVSLDRSHGAWRFSMREPADGSAELVPAMTIPQILNRSEFSGSIDLLKCDVEGAEKEIFADCRDWIGCVRNLIVELHHPYSAEQFCQHLHRAGARFEVYHRASSNENSELLFLERASLKEI